MDRRILGVVLMLALTLGVVPQAASATTPLHQVRYAYVNGSANQGCDQPSSNCSLQGALSVIVANSTTTVYLESTGSGLAFPGGVSFDPHGASVTITPLPGGTAPSFLEGDISSSGSLVSILGADGGTVSFTNVTFEHANAAQGAALTVAGGVSLSLTNCSFIANTATSDGGAVLFSAPSSTAPTLSITHSTFSGNTAGGSGGAIDVTADYVSATMTDNDFSSNTATTGGAINFHVAGPVVHPLYVSGHFTNNSATNGGAIALSPSYNYTKVDTLAIDNATFANNQARVGGAIDVADNTTISGTTFTSNQAVGGGSATGGALTVEGNDYETPLVTLDQDVFTSNTSSGVGGAIATTATGLSTDVTITNGSFVANVAATGGGAIAVPGGGLLVAFSSFLRNQVTAGQGGAIEASLPSSNAFVAAGVLVLRSTFDANDGPSTADIANLSPQGIVAVAGTVLVASPLSTSSATAVEPCFGTITSLGYNRQTAGISCNLDQASDLTGSSVGLTPGTTTESVFDNATMTKAIPLGAAATLPPSRNALSTQDTPGSSPHVVILCAPWLFDQNSYAPSGAACDVGALNGGLTPSPALAAGSATLITSHSARVTATVTHPHSFASVSICVGTSKATCRYQLPLSTAEKPPTQTVNLTALLPDTTYWYRVRQVGPGMTSTSSWRTFHTALASVGLSRLQLRGDRKNHLHLSFHVDSTRAGRLKVLSYCVTHDTFVPPHCGPSSWHVLSLTRTRASTPFNISTEIPQQFSNALVYVTVIAVNQEGHESSATTSAFIPPFSG